MYDVRSLKRVAVERVEYRFFECRTPQADFYSYP